MGRRGGCLIWFDLTHEKINLLLLVRLNPANDLEGSQGRAGWALGKLFGVFWVVFGVPRWTPWGLSGPSSWLCWGSLLVCRQVHGPFRFSRGLGALTPGLLFVVSWIRLAWPE